MQGRLAPSRRLALLFILAVGAVLGVVLFSQSARVPLRTPLVPRAARTTPVAVPLEAREGRRGIVFRLELTARDPASLLAHDELQLFLESATPGRAPTRAELQLRGTGCTLVAASHAQLTTRSPTVFRRSDSCAAVRDIAGPLSLDLVLEAEGGGAVALLGFVPAADAEPAPVQVAPTRGRPTPLDVRGAFVDYPETAPRIVLLNHMWRLAPGLGWLASLVALAIALACAGCFVFPTRPPANGAPSTATMLRGAGGAALFAASLTLLHGVLEPPLSGPDEPYHLLGLADLVKDEALAADTVAWMAETHLWRIRQQPGERFRTIDVGQPYVVEDDQLRPTEVAMRSAVLARLWRAMAPLVRGQSAPRTLLTLRLLNALLFSLAVASAAALAMALVAEPFPQWLSFPFLFVPSLPFFAMHVSETSMLCSIYALLGASVAVICLDGPRAHWTGPPLGLATGLMLAGGRSPWPLSALVAAVLAGRALLGQRASVPGARAAVVFWGGFVLGAGVLFLVLDDAYRMMTEGYARVHTRHFPGWLRPLGLWLLAHPGAAACLVLAGGVLEVALAPVRARFATWVGGGARWLVSRTAIVLAVVVIVSLVGSLFVAYPQLPLEPRHPLTAGERVFAVLGTMATMFRLTQPNFLLASSFWVGFGWLDTMPKAPVQGLLVALMGLSCAALLLYVGRYQQVRRFVWLLTCGAGLIAALLLYTLSTQELIAALQGRYLIGWYLVLLSLVAGALTLDYRAGPDAGHSAEPTGSTRAGLMLVVAGLVHLYCLSFVLQRYF